VPDIFDEIAEDLRAERAEKLLRKYAAPIIAAFILVVCAVGGWQAWRWWEAKQDARAANQFVTAMNVASRQSSDPKAAAAAFAPLLKSAPEGYKTLARLQAAALDAKAGNLRDATALWDDVAADRDADPLLRGLASLLWAQHQIDQGDPEILKARLKPLASPDNPWHTLAQEQLALLDMREGKNADAKALLERLSNDVTAPSGVRARAGGLLTRLNG
jgi:hypothetical protein